MKRERTAKEVNDNIIFNALSSRLTIVPLRKCLVDDAGITVVSSITDLVNTVRAIIG